MTDDEPKRGRAHTMQLRALRRLSETELLGLRHALDVVSRTEAEMITVMSDMRKAADREDAARRAARVTTPGPYARAYRCARRALLSLSWARQEVEPVVDAGKVPKREG